MKTLIIDDGPNTAGVVALCFEIRWPNTEVLTACDGQICLRLWYLRRKLRADANTHSIIATERSMGYKRLA